MESSNARPIRNSVRAHSALVDLLTCCPRARFKFLRRRDDLATASTTPQRLSTALTNSQPQPIQPHSTLSIPPNPCQHRMRPPGEGGRRDRSIGGRVEGQRRVGSMGRLAASSPLLDAASSLTFSRGAGGGRLRRRPMLLLGAMPLLVLLVLLGGAGANLLTPISMGLDLGNHKRCVCCVLLLQDEEGRDGMPITRTRVESIV